MPDRIHERISEIGGGVMSYEWDQDETGRKMAFKWWLSLMVIAAVILAVRLLLL